MGGGLVFATSCLPPSARLTALPGVMGWGRVGCWVVGRVWGGWTGSESSAGVAGLLDPSHTAVPSQHQ